MHFKSCDKYFLATANASRVVVQESQFSVPKPKRMKY